MPGRGELVGLFTALLAIASMAVGLRLFARTRRGVRLAIDDGVIILAWMLAVALFACCAHGVARRVWLHYLRDLTMSGIQEGLKLVYAFTVLYTPAMAATRSSILLFYRRINPKQGFRLMVWIALAVTICNAIAFTFAVIFQCHPIKYNWNRLIPGGHCVNQTNMYVTGGSIGMALDIWTLLIPIPMVWELQMPRRQKVAFTIIFLLGLFTCVASAMRLYYLRKIVSDEPLCKTPVLGDIIIGFLDWNLRKADLTANDIEL
ncbi:MAG: hypothetical protein M1816_000248 [Peltula sp. TS41687]|nr:MAG: hypothetical protein M1816_000248 [Peltula sp. TS41687]